MGEERRPSRRLRWKLWALLGTLALAWGYYAAPIYLTKRIRNAAAAGTPPLIASRVDFSRVNARLSGDLRQATGGRLDAESFSHLLLYGWLPQQRQKTPAATPGLPASANQTQLYHIRYKGLNRFIAILWDAHQVHEVVLTLERKSPLHRWHVTKVVQFNTCAYAFDCAQVQIGGLGSATAGPVGPPRTDAHERSAVKDR